MTILIEHAKVLTTGVMRFFGFERKGNTTLATQFHLNVAQLTDIGRAYSGAGVSMTHLSESIK